jgi:murein DD-endopeptidase MepM/ murein hydrolase activator NlpD
LKFKEKKRGPFGIIFSLLFVIFAVVGGYIYLSPAFEQNKPEIISSDNIYWNLKSPIKIDLKDESGIKYYKVTFRDGQKSVVLNQKVLTEIKKDLSIEIVPPKLDMFYKGVDTSLEVEVVDNSKWNLLEGNKALKIIDVKIDTLKPIANVIDNSRYIQRGGSAVVVVKVKDANLKEAYISFNDEKKFKLIPYYKEDYYVALIAWPIDFEEFSRVNLVAVDKADNKTITKVPFYIQKKKIRVDNINLSENFIKNISASVLEQSFEPIPQDIKEIFLYSNRELRAKNVKTIEESVQKYLDNQFIENVTINSFDRLRGSKTVAGYGERRHYYLDGEKINEAWHLGIDWASVKKAPVRVSNDGTVIFNGYLGLYGNTIIIDHGMGLATLYAHTSSQSVKLGDQVTKNQKIANTGSTGAVFGDHLHFGVLIQGIEVNPIEWMDNHWIKVRITDVLSSAKKLIDGK